MAEESPATSELHKGAEGQIKSFSAPAVGAEVARRSWPPGSRPPCALVRPARNLSLADAPPLTPVSGPSRGPAAALRVVPRSPATAAAAPLGRAVWSGVEWSGRLCFLLACPTTGCRLQTLIVVRTRLVGMEPRRTLDLVSNLESACYRRSRDRV